MNNISRIDFYTGIFNCSGELISGTKDLVTVLFNPNVISAAKAQSLIRNGRYLKDDRLIVVTPKQADNLLRVSLPCKAGDLYDKEDT